MLFRQDVTCFDSDDHTCYSLAFGVPAALMLIATLILIVGKPLYVFKEPQGNVLTQVCGSVWVGENFVLHVIVILINVFNRLILSVFQSFTKTVVSCWPVLSFFGQSYCILIIIGFTLAQSDHIKWRLMYVKMCGLSVTVKPLICIVNLVTW
jgi:hypothetical protein